MIAEVGIIASPVYMNINYKLFRLNPLPYLESDGAVITMI